ncbi:MAG: hypothetical protein EU544_04865 [Promethearchaeota archaeon]|nr:MAG: hypothetical protein EU544_04865 [Candidatus Lokiarchaeota archaeon]
MESAVNAPEFSYRERILYSMIFVMGLIFCYAPFMPIGILCASFLLFQKKSKQFQILALILFTLQIIVLYIFLDMVLEAQELF